MLTEALKHIKWENTRCIPYVLLNRDLEKDSADLYATGGFVPFVDDAPYIPFQTRLLFCRSGYWYPAYFVSHLEFGRVLIHKAVGAIRTRNNKKKLVKLSSCNVIVDASCVPVELLQPPPPPVDERKPIVAPVVEQEIVIAEPVSTKEEEQEVVIVEPVSTKKEEEEEVMVIEKAESTAITVVKRVRFDPDLPPDAGTRGLSPKISPGEYFHRILPQFSNTPYVGNGTVLPYEMQFTHFQRYMIEEIAKWMKKYTDGTMTETEVLSSIEARFLSQGNRPRTPLFHTPLLNDYMQIRMFIVLVRKWYADKWKELGGPI